MLTCHVAKTNTLKGKQTDREVPLLAHAEKMKPNLEACTYIRETSGCD